MSENPTPAPQPNEQPVHGFAPTSVTVFTLGFAGLLVPLIGLVPSVMAVSKTREARREIANSKGRLRGLGLTKAGNILGWLGLFNGLLTIAAVVAGVWAIDNLLPTLLGSPSALMGTGLSGTGSSLGSGSLLSLLEGQDLNALLSDPAVVEGLKQRLVESGVDPNTLFDSSTPTPTPTATPKP